MIEYKWNVLLFCQRNDSRQKAIVGIWNSTSAASVRLNQGCIAKWVMAVKDSRKCRGLAACVTEALEHASPYQETLLVVQWKMIQMSPLDCQVGTGEVRWKCEPQASVAICVIQHLRSAPTLCPSLTDNPASQPARLVVPTSAGLTPSPWRHWASCCVIITCVFKTGLTCLSGPRLRLRNQQLAFWLEQASWKSHVTVLHRVNKKGRRYKKQSRGSHAEMRHMHPHPWPCSASYLTFF